MCSLTIPVGLRLTGNAADDDASEGEPRDRHLHYAGASSLAGFFADIT